MIRDIAPQNIIIKDYESLRERERLNTTRDIEELIFIQSLEGRAHNGAGFFAKKFYVNTTIDDIVKALGLDAKEVKTKRQQLIDDILWFVDRTIEGKAGNKLKGPDGHPLLGIPDFREFTVNPQDVLKGIFIGGLRDNPEIRAQTEKKYDIRIGFGKCYPINITVMEKMGLNGELLAHQEHADNLDKFKQAGLIIEQDDLGKIDEVIIRYMYIRYKLGPGQSDDAALIAAGLLYNIDVALGIFLADAMDTLEKYVCKYKDQDSDLSYDIMKRKPDLGVSMDDVYEIAYLAAIPEGREENTPDSSLRYFITIDNETGQTAIESHLNFIQKKKFFPMNISFNRILSTEFYRYIKEKMLNLKKGEVPAPAVEAKEIGWQAQQVMDKKFITVSPDESLKHALVRARDLDCDMIVVVDNNKNILGIIDKMEYMHLLDDVHRKK